MRVYASVGFDAYVTILLKKLNRVNSSTLQTLTTTIIWVYGEKSFLFHMPSPVKKNTPLIKGQSSLSGFFSNGRLSLAESSIKTTTPSPQKVDKSGSKEKTKSSKDKGEAKSTPSKAKKEQYTGPPVEEVKEKVCYC